jgi:hypothetical protein
MPRNSSACDAGLGRLIDEDGRLASRIFAEAIVHRGDLERWLRGGQG